MAAESAFLDDLIEAVSHEYALNADHSEQCFLAPHCLGQLLLEFPEPRFESRYVVTQCVHAFPETVNFMPPGDGPAFFLQVFADVLAHR